MKKTVILLSLISIIIIFFFFTYQKDISKRFSSEIKNINKKPNPEKSKKEIINELKNVSYENFDAKGNFYEIKSDISESYKEKPYESFMKKVTAKITLIDGRIIIITSDFAIYNRENNNTNFFDNVIVIESNNKITSDKLDFIYTSDMIYLRENIIMTNEFGNILSDMVDIDLNEGFAKIYMTDNKDQVKVDYKK
tara:strand:- start:473 stop:1057 length:585 start_codon:yes stop_codon:yes gene_type:complete